LSTSTVSSVPSSTATGTGLRPVVVRRKSARRALATLADLSAVTEQTARDDTGEVRRKRRVAARALYAVVAIVVTIVALVVWVFPTRTWMAQRQATQQTAEKLDVIETETERLEAQVRSLQTPAEIERLARERYNLVKPGEKAYVVLPATLPTFPATAGYNVVQAFFTVGR
jgi:cell division protein FtsB